MLGVLIAMHRYACVCAKLIQSCLILCLESLPLYTQSRHYYNNSVHLCWVVSRCLSLPLFTAHLLNIDLLLGFICLKHILLLWHVFHNCYFIFPLERCFTSYLETIDWLSFLSYCLKAKRELEDSWQMFFRVLYNFFFFFQNFFFFFFF